MGQQILRVHCAAERCQQAKITAKTTKTAKPCRTSLCLALELEEVRAPANATSISRGLLGSCHRNACHESGGRMCHPMLLWASTWISFNE